MKLAIPLQNEFSNEGVSLAQSFTETDTMCIYDSEAKHSSTVSISKILEEYETDNLIMLIKKLGITSVISSKFMPMAMKYFNRNNIIMLKAENTNLTDTIEQFHNGGLSEFTEEDAIISGCTGSCGSCSSDTCSTK